MERHRAGSVRLGSTNQNNKALWTSARWTSVDVNKVGHDKDVCPSEPNKHRRPNGTATSGGVKLAFRAWQSRNQNASVRRKMKISAGSSCRCHSSNQLAFHVVWLGIVCRCVPGSVSCIGSNRSARSREDWDQSPDAHLTSSMGDWVQLMFQAFAKRDTPELCFQALLMPWANKILIMRWSNMKGIN